MTAGLIAVAVVAVLVALGALTIALRGGRTRAAADAKTAEIAQSAAALGDTQTEIMVRLKALAEAQTVAQSDMTRTLNERLDAVSKRMGERLESTAVKTAESLGDLKKHLNVIDDARKNMEELAGQVVGLQDILSNKQARGAFGEIQLNDIVRNALPPSAYEMQATLSNGKRANCLIKLPNPPGAIAIDAKFPLESYHALRNAADDAARTQAARQFRADILRHVTEISAKYIVPGETAESALMFLPSEAVYAELHANFTEVVEKSYRLRVWIVSPTTLMATLNTVRAVLKDARMREQAGVIQKEVLTMLDNVRRLDGQAAEPLRTDLGGYTPGAHLDRQDHPARRANRRSPTRRRRRGGSRQSGREGRGETADYEKPGLHFARARRRRRVDLRPGAGPAQAGRTSAKIKPSRSTTSPVTVSMPVENMGPCVTTV